MKFKPFLRQVIKILKIDGVLDSTGITEMIIFNYEEVEELFEHGLGSQLVAKLLTEDHLYDCCENEDRTIEDDENNPRELDGDEYDYDYDEDDDDDISEEENVDNLCFEPDDDYEDDSDDSDDMEEENIDNQTSEPNEDDNDCLDGCGYKITSFFDSRFYSAKFLKSEYSIFLIRIQNNILLF